MSYHVSIYLFIFLPIALLLYQVTPKRFRWITLLIESYLFFILLSKFLLIYLLAVTALTYLVGRWIGRLQDKCTEQLASADKSQKSEIKKKSKKEQKRVLVLAIILLLAGIFFYKYRVFFLFNLDKLTHFTGGYDWSTLERGAVPIGISFYTLEAIGYMTDVYWGKISGKQPLGKIALFLAFFPQIMEGPIALYNQTSESLWSGRSLSYNNLRDGAIRITWGLFKKYLVADRLAPLVTELYNNYANYNGVMIVVAAVAYTIQLYMEFSGSMDMIIGTGQMFGVTLPENFNQPFFSGNASEFWRRWHITLGIWFKTYIFYPVSTSGLVKKWRKFGNKHFGNKAFGKYLTKLGISAICLLPVWLCNGLWHGPAWNYIFYGIYYFIVILAGLALDPVRDMVIKKTGADPQALYWRVPQILKTWVIIFVGELLFRANGLKAALVMYRNLFVGFSLKPLWDGTLLGMNLDKGDYIIVVISVIVVAIVGFIKEKKCFGGKALSDFKLPVRWIIYLALILAVLTFGAYGIGYSEVDLIYAGF